MDSPFVTAIIPWPSNFPPRNWSYCQGQEVSISQYTTVFALLGTIYGGNGRTSFKLPDLQGRVPIGAGNGPGLQRYIVGQSAGLELNKLRLDQLPAHAHNNTLTTSKSAVSGTVSASVTMSVQKSDAQRIQAQAGDYLAASVDKKADTFIYGSDTASGTVNLEGLAMGAAEFNGETTPKVTITNGASGGDSFVENRQPYSVVNYIIAMDGIFPSRN